MRAFFLFIGLFFLTSCDDGFDLTNTDNSQLVVEGWIEDDGFPIVILTRSMAISTEYRNMEDLNDYFIRWAKVTVNNGSDSVVLTGKYDKGFFPPFIYTTSKMRGEVGKHYTLTMEYKDYHATATTTIPSVPEHCSFSVERSLESDTLFQITAIFNDNPKEKNYYQFFTRLGTKTKQFQASLLGTIDDTVLDNVTKIPVYRGQQLNQKGYTPFFTLSDTVSVKFAQIDETSFRIWDSYTKMLSLSSNMFLSTITDITTNIKGGYGYWCGFGAITDHIVIQDSIQRGY